MSKHISILGLGAMGKALALKCVDNGFATTVWNRTPEKAQFLIAKGATSASTVSEAFDASSLVVICLLDNASVKETLSRAIPPLPKKTTVNLTNGTPSQARELSEWVTSFGASTSTVE